MILERKKPQGENKCCGYSKNYVTDRWYSWGSYKIIAKPTESDPNQYYKIKCEHKIESSCRQEMIDIMRECKILK